ncbi:phosphatidylinositol 4-kinase gamma-like protein [Actinidia rufa]|uniref:Phosphatidylinositol 4-kinase gamma-like protein n=1 Tax=Actinidia rufa TaxID=165716 RepID=A0A7J0E5J1_9ERIC|nr:phosphatidylinositol 4-kinase gamma-like protein [Actinidia rufa]
MCSHASHIHPAAEERVRERAYSLCHRKHHVQRKLDEGIRDRRDCLGSSAGTSEVCIHGSSLPCYGSPHRRLDEITK